MSPTFGIILMMNNYFHDVATALLVASGAALWIVHHNLGDNRDTVVLRYYLTLYRSMTRVAKFAIAWIILGGIPRTIFYMDFEWANAAGKNQVPALIVKHVLAFMFVGIGAHLWIRMRNKVREIEKTLAADRK